MSGLCCSGCGSTDVVFDPKARIVSCRQCGKQETYTRSTLNLSGEVVFAKDNAIRFFNQGDLSEAMHYARDVLNISKDNIPALFIGGYYNEFVLGKTHAMAGVLEEICQMPDVLYDEVLDIQTLVLHGALNLVDYQTQILNFVWENMQDPQDGCQLSDFIDKICPYFISKELTSEYLDDELCDLYCKLVLHCDIPQTCFALLSSIKKIADSPFRSDCFHLHARCLSFQDTYIKRVGKILEAMKNTQIKDKFLIAYKQIEQEYSQRMEGVR